MAAPVTPRPQHAFGRTPVQIETSAGKGSITLPELIKLGGEILARARRSGLVLGGDLEGFNTLYEDLWGRYKEFAKEFPIIFRWIVYYFEFDDLAFRTYLTKSHEVVWKDKPHMLKAQVDYLVFLRRRRLPNEKGKQLEDYRKYIWKHLETEHENFEKAGKEAEEVHKKNEEVRTLKIREALRETALRVAGAKVPAAEEAPAAEEVPAAEEMPAAAQ